MHNGITTKPSNPLDLVYKVELKVLSEPFPLVVCEDLQDKLLTVFIGKLFSLDFDKISKSPHDELFTGYHMDIGSVIFDPCLKNLVQLSHKKISISGPAQKQHTIFAARLHVIGLQMFNFRGLTGGNYFDLP